jgi:twitching motility protein PilT
MSTLHTIDAAETVGRMIEFFPPEKQEVIRAILAGVLRGVVSQRLLPKEGGGRVAAVEVMVMNARIADLIREGRADEITDAVAEGEFFQMQTFTQALIEHVLAGSVDRETAANAATNKHDFLVALEQAIKRKRAADAAAAAEAEAQAAAAETEPQQPAAPQPLAPSAEPAGEGFGLRIAPAG